MDVSIQKNSDAAEHQISKFSTGKSVSVRRFPFIQVARTGANALSENAGFAEKVRRTDERRAHFERALQELSAVEW
jgi:hypothetical protein